MGVKIDWNKVGGIGAWFALAFSVYSYIFPSDINHPAKIEFPWKIIQMPLWQAGLTILAVVAVTAWSVRRYTFNKFPATWQEMVRKDELIAELTATRDEHAKQITHLASAAQSCRQQLQQQDDEVKKQATKIASYEIERKSLQKALDDTLSAKKVLEEADAGNRERIEELKTKIDVANASLNKTQQHLGKYADSYLQADKDLSDTKTKQKELEQQIAALKNNDELDVMTVKAKRFEELLKQKHLELAGKQTLLQDTANALSVSEEDRLKKERLIEALEETQAHNNVRLAETLRNYGELDRVRIAAEKARDVANKKLTETERQVLDWKQVYEQADEERTQLREEVIEAKGRLGMADGTKEYLINRKNRLEEENDRLKNQPPAPADEITFSSPNRIRAKIVPKIDSGRKAYFVQLTNGMKEGITKYTFLIHTAQSQDSESGEWRENRLNPFEFSRDNYIHAGDPDVDALPLLGINESNDTLIAGMRPDHPLLFAKSDPATTQRWQVRSKIIIMARRPPNQQDQVAVIELNLLVEWDKTPTGLTITRNLHD